ncbi:MAG TPA: phytoene/squalene synthase family protein [Actinocrinis sp.]
MTADTRPAPIAIPPRLQEAYKRCRSIHREYDPAFYAGCLMLPAPKRPHVDALYAHARMLDQIVDDQSAGPAAAVERLDARLADFARLMKDGDAGDSDIGGGTDPVLAAAAHTARTFTIPLAYFDTFADAMRSDLTVTEYPTFEDLRVYMHGAAALLGLQIVPILGPIHPEASERATAVGYALQMTNILRDVEEDLDRGRVYLPLEDLERFGVSTADLRERRMTEPLRELLRFEEKRARAYYERAFESVEMLHPSSRQCVYTALTLYSGILDSLVAADYRVFGTRHGLNKARTLRIALPAYIRARRSWRRADLPPA